MPKISEQIFFIILFGSLLFIFPALAFSGTASYFYDDTGRLTKAVSDAGEAAIYNYDEVGNLISTTREIISQSPPVITGSTPDVFFIGSTNTVTLSGENLLSTERVVPDNGGLVVNTFKASDTVINASVTVSSDAPLGPASLLIGTLYGTVSIPIDVASLSFSPSRLSVMPGVTEVSAIAEGASRDVTVVLNNWNPETILAPQSVTLTGGNITTFNINALNKGTGVISSENGWLTIYVTEAFTGNSSATTKPISVYVTAGSGNSMTSSSPVSVYRSPSSGAGTIISNPVSVYRSPSSGAGIIISNPVSVQKSP